MFAKTSGIGSRAAARSDFDAALIFVGIGGVELVVETGPRRIARIHFLIEKFARVVAPPCLGGKAFQHARPAAVRIIVAVGMQAGIDVGDGAPCADEIGFLELFELRGERAAKLAASAAQRSSRRLDGN